MRWRFVGHGRRLPQRLLLASDLFAIPDIWNQTVDHAEYMRTIILEVTVVVAALLASTYAASRLTSNHRVWTPPSSKGSSGS